MQSICQQLNYERKEGMRDLKKLWFIWTARDPALIDEMDITNSCHSCSLGNSRIIHETEDLDGVDTPKYQQHKKMHVSPVSYTMNATDPCYQNHKHRYLR